MCCWYRHKQTPHMISSGRKRQHVHRSRQRGTGPPAQQHAVDYKDHHPDAVHEHYVALQSPVHSVMVKRSTPPSKESLRTRKSKKEERIVFPSLHLKVLRPPSAPAAAPAERPAAPFAARVSPPPRGVPPRSLAPHGGPPGSRSSRNSPNPSAPCHAPEICPLLAPTRLRLHNAKKSHFKSEIQSILDARGLGHLQRQTLQSDSVRHFKCPVRGQ